MAKSDLMKVSSNPHVRSKATTSSIMLCVVIALLPAAGFGVYHFGARALMHICITVGTCVLSELLYEIMMRKKVTIMDFSAVVTGLLLAMNLPVSAPWWMGMMGGVFAIIIVKMLFGGLGQNFMNPALGARCFLLIAFTQQMTNFDYDAVTGPTPLAQLRAGGLTSNTVLDMITGNIQGTIGETSMIALVIGACFLIMMGIIDLRIPGSYIVSFVIFLIVFGEKHFDSAYIAAQVAGGGLMLGAFFMATDYVTRPITKKGQYLYGIFLGVMTGMFRLFGASAEGVSYAIIIGNLLVPLIEKITMPKPFGKGGEHS